MRKILWWMNQAMYKKNLTSNEPFNNAHKITWQWTHGFGAFWFLPLVARTCNHWTFIIKCHKKTQMITKRSTLWSW
jgi:hypothetical protein